MPELRVAHGGTAKVPVSWWVRHGGVNKAVREVWVRGPAGTNVRVYTAETATPEVLTFGAIGGVAEIGWTNTASYPTEVWRDGALRTTVAAGENTFSEAIASAHTYRLRYAYGGGLYSSFTEEMEITP
jgi:hypothetical protein